jgi:hypothetical protein
LPSIAGELYERVGVSSVELEQSLVVARLLDLNLLALGAEIEVYY